LHPLQHVAERRGVDGDRGAGGELPGRVEVDRPGDLVAGYEGLTDDERPVRAVVVVVQVRAADAGVRDAQPHLAGGRLRGGDLGDGEVLLAVDDDGPHGSSYTTAVMPPSTKMFCPETKLEASEHR